MRALLALLESHGGGALPEADVERALAKDGPEVRAAALAAGIVRTAPLAATHPCDALSCAREVREAASSADGARRFLAVCTQSPRACETLRLRERDLVQREVALEALLRVVARELAIEEASPSGRAPRGGRGEEIALLGEQTAGVAARDVFFARRPSEPVMRALLAERRAASRPALVLVLTARGVKPDLLAAHGAGHVEIACLSDALSVEEGRFVVAERLRDLPRPPRGAREKGERGAGPSGLLAKLPRAERWSQVSFYSVSGDNMLAVEIERRTRRVSARDLGMATATGEPVRAFTLLQRICDGNGMFDTRRWGSQENGKKVVSELRAALTKAFEIEESPIEPYSRGTRSWKTRFRAYSSPPAEIRAMLREALRDDGG